MADEIERKTSEAGSVADSEHDTENVLFEISYFYIVFQDNRFANK